MHVFLDSSRRICDDSVRQGIVVHIYSLWEISSPMFGIAFTASEESITIIIITMMMMMKTTTTTTIKTLI